jgi:hypothetical protein
MLVTSIHCSDYRAKGILKTVLFFGYLFPSYYGFTCFFLPRWCLWWTSVLTLPFVWYILSLSFGQYNHVSLDSDWLLQRINWYPCTLQFSDMCFRQKWNLYHAVLLRWLDVHLINTPSQHICVGMRLNYVHGLKRS